jgi:RNA polymerase sigma-70 factor (ECF subfamily)
MTFQEIYEAQFGFVWRSLRRLGVRESEAPDAVQEVFLTVHRRLPEFEGRSKVSTWIFGIAMRVAAARRRIAHRRYEVPGEDLIPTFESEGDLSEQVARRQGLEIVEAILERMPIEQRAVFALFELEGMSGDEIAELLEIPKGTVHSRLRLARAVFREQVERLTARERSRMRMGGAR